MRQKLLDAFAILPSSFQDILKPVIYDQQFDATISAEIVQQLCSQHSLSHSDLTLALLPLAAAYSVAPISNFHVGAIATAESGRLYFGANMEFESTQLNAAIHAEQSAISHAWLKGETTIQQMTINYSPCGHCRQFMNELNHANSLIIQLPHHASKTLSDYLPESFGPADLNIQTPLLTPIDHGFSHPDQIQNQLLQAAIHATNQSHSPYSKSPSGVAIQLKDNAIFVGRYAENAAFNPSLAPLQVALNLMNLTNRTFNEIKSVVLVERESAQVKQGEIIQHILNSFDSRIDFKIYQI